MPILVLSSNGQPITKSTLSAANTDSYAAGKNVSVTSSITLSDNFTWSSDRTLEIGPGGQITIASGKTLTIPGHLFKAGGNQVFAGSGSVVFSTNPINGVFPEWFPGSDYGAQISNAVASIRAIGGKIKFTKSATVTTAINATKLTQGVVFEGVGASFDGETTNIMLTFQLTTVGFDCSGSNNIHFKDFTIDTHATTYPKAGFLLARNALGSGAGEHVFTNVRVNGTAKFSVATLYGYGSEVLSFFNCVFVNNIAGKDVIYLTAYNTIDPVNSVYLTGSGADGYATGAQSNSTFNFFGCSLYNLGGTNSNLFHLDSAADLHWYGGFWFNASASANGLAYIFVDDIHASSDIISIDGVRSETGTYKSRFGIYYSGSTLSTVTGWSITNSRMSCAERVIFGNTNSTISGLLYKNNLDTDGVGISVYNLAYADIDLRPTPLILAAAGTLSHSTVTGDRTQFTLSGTVVTTTFVDTALGNNTAYQATVRGSTTAGGGLVRKTVETDVVITGTTIDTNMVSIGTRLLGAQFRVTSALAGGETWNAAFASGSTTSLVTAGAVAKNTKINKMIADEIATGTVVLRITKSGGGAFTTQGVIKAIIYYEDFETVTSAP